MTASAPLASSGSSPTPRFASLDGLRGVAALVVLLHHVAFAIPSFALTYISWDLPARDTVAWWAAYTPAKLLTAGPEAVIVFFLLSGFVLALEPFAKPGFDWLAYYPRRIVRLYVPIVASVVLGVALIALVPRNPQDIVGGWVANLSNPVVSPKTIVQEMSVLFAPTFAINPPLWSLVWEVWFSLLLPLFVAAVVLLRRAWWWGVILGFALSTAGMIGHQTWLVYLPMFLIGVALARGVDDLRRMAARIQSWRFGTLIWAAVLVLGLVLLVFTWILRGFGVIDTVTAATVSPITVAGATLIVIACAFWPGAVRALTTRPAAWLGRISYSLYLVHLPILLAVVFLVGDRQTWLVVGISIPLCLAAAWAFWRLVESPAHRLARWFGRRTAQARADFR